jgi:hypothetical protein
MSGNGGMRGAGTARGAGDPRVPVASGAHNATWKQER